MTAHASNCGPSGWSLHLACDCWHSGCPGQVIGTQLLPGVQQQLQVEAVVTELAACSSCTTATLNVMHSSESCIPCSRHQAVLWLPQEALLPPLQAVPCPQAAQMAAGGDVAGGSPHGAQCGGGGGHHQGGTRAHGGLPQVHCAGHPRAGLQVGLLHPGAVTTAACLLMAGCRRPCSQGSLQALQQCVPQPAQVSVPISHCWQSTVWQLPSWCHLLSAQVIKVHVGQHQHVLVLSQCPPQAMQPLDFCASSGSLPCTSVLSQCVSPAVSPDSRALLCLPTALQDSTCLYCCTGSVAC